MSRQLSLAVVGVRFANKRGPGRQFEVAMCKPGEIVELRPEPNNPADPNAIAVYSDRNIQLGYVTAERAPYILQQMHRGIVTAIFQAAETWGATIRVGLDGEAPVLPSPSESTSHQWPPPMSHDTDWWPDDIPPDDQHQ